MYFFSYYISAYYFLIFQSIIFQSPTVRGRSLTGIGTGTGPGRRTGTGGGTAAAAAAAVGTAAERTGVVRRPFTEVEVSRQFFHVKIFDILKL